MRFFYAGCVYAAISFTGASIALADGACCIETSCAQASNEASCSSIGGVFLDGKTCASGACGVGACCFSGSCATIDAYNCIFNGRTFGGAGTTCIDDPCGDNRGVCCTDGQCTATSRATCEDGGGTWLGAGTNCEEDAALCTLGACCSPGACHSSAGFQCIQQHGVFNPSGSCAGSACEVLNDCPTNSLFAQTREEPNFSGAYLSEASTGVVRWDNFESVGGTIDEVRWFGLALTFDGGGPSPCAEAIDQFEITLYADDFGALGSPVCSYTLNAPRTDSGLIYFGYFANEYRAKFNPPCVLTEGWMSIVGTGSANCFFYWLSSNEGDHLSLCEGCDSSRIGDDFNFCLLGDAGGVVGACCNESTGVCNESVNISNCLGIGKFFAPNLDCDTAPACRAIAGACCVFDGACTVGSEVDCATRQGDWLGPATSCNLCPPTGACCLDENICTVTTEPICDALRRTWAGPDTTCEDCFTLPVCPADSLFAQTPDGPSDFLGGSSEQSSPFRRFENFSGVGGATTALTWWGFTARFLPELNAFQVCTEPDDSFLVAFYTDAGGVPGDQVCEFTVQATKTPKGISYLGAGLLEYAATLPEPGCALVEGWVSIWGQGDPDCWFIWLSSDVGDSYCAGCSIEQQSADLSVCIRGTVGGVAGACCDEVNAACTDGTDIADCTLPQQRFRPHQTCAALVPPCGVILGACCHDDLPCQIQTQQDCLVNKGNWHGADTRCAACPCRTPCPAHGAVEGEPTCGDDYVDAFNGGCDSVAEKFSPITFCNTVCGTGGVFSAAGHADRDEDWYEIVVDDLTTLNWIVEAEFEAVAAIVDGNQGCAGATILDIAVNDDPCTLLTVVAAVGPGTYWVVVTPASASDQSICGARYRATLTGEAHCPYDFNGDGAVDRTDYAQFALCLRGPGVAPSANCAVFDGDGDGDVDIDDFVGFLSEFSP